MSQPAAEEVAEQVGRDVLGPIVAEFCLRLWSLGSLMRHRDTAAMLFCARGGLRIQLAYERFLAATELEPPLRQAPLMVSRVVAIRPTLLRAVEDGHDDLLPATASTLLHEFPHASVADVARATAGTDLAATRSRWDAPFRPAELVALLRHADGEPAHAALAEQSSLFRTHLLDVLDGRRHAVLVDTGLYGTTRQLLAEGLPDVLFSSALIARSYRPGLAVRGARTTGLSVEARGYSPWHRRTAMLRYWHFIEWLFEPDLPSVRTFSEHGGGVRSNLEVDGWRERIAPAPGTAAAGMLAYLDALPAGAGAQVVEDADRAWDAFRRAVIWPDRGVGQALAVGARSHDFGSDATWDQRPWTGVRAAMRGASMWREGEIARSGSALRVPMLMAIEAAYTLRHARRTLSHRRRA